MKKYENVELGNGKKKFKICTCHKKDIKNADVIEKMELWRVSQSATLMRCWKLFHGFHSVRTQQQKIEITMTTLTTNGELDMVTVGKIHSLLDLYVIYGYRNVDDVRLIDVSTN